MKLFLKNRGILHRFDLKFCKSYNFSKPFSSNGSFSESDGKVVPPVDEGISKNSVVAEGTRQAVDEICQILESGPWIPSLESSLLVNCGKPQPESVIRVLRRLKDVNLAVNYFRWSERQINEAHCPEAYNSLLMVMARSRDFNWLEQILEEMSIAGIGPSNYASVELVVSCVKAQKLREAFDLIQTMRRFKFRPAESTRLGKGQSHSNLRQVLMHHKFSLSGQECAELLTRHEFPVNH